VLHVIKCQVGAEGVVIELKVAGFHQRRSSICAMNVLTKVLNFIANVFLYLIPSRSAFCLNISEQRNNNKLLQVLLLCL